MLKAAERSELRAHRERLRRWDTDVPRDAVEFHEAATELLDQLQDALKFGGMFTASDAAREINEQMRSLVPVADGIQRLFARKVEVEEAVDVVETRAAVLADDALRQRVGEWRAEWRARLVGYGAHVRRREALAQDVAAVERVASLVQETREGLDLLIEADGLRRRLANEPAQIALLVTEFDGWKLRFREDGPNPSLLAEIENCLIPLRLRATASRAEQPPAEGFGPVRELIFEAERWADVLGKDATEPERMQSELGRLESAWTSTHLPALQQLEAEAQQFVEGARGAARALRDAEVAHLQEWHRHFRAIASSGPDAARLENEIDELSKLTIDSPDAFRDWRDRRAAVEELFVNLSTSRRAEIVRLLIDRIESALARAEDIQPRRLTASLQVDLKMVDTRLIGARHAAPSYSPAQLFRALSDIDKALDEIKDIKRQAERYLQGLEELRGRAAAHYEMLRSASASVQATVPDIADDLATVIAAAQTADAAADRLQQLEGIIASSTEAFIASCRRETNDLAAEIADLDRLLADVTDSSASSFPAPAIAAEAEPASAAAALRLARTHHAALSDRLRGEHTRLRERLAAALAEVDEWLSAGTALAPGDRGPAAELRQDLVAAQELTTSDAAAVRALHEALTKHDRFHDRVRSDELQARRRSRRVRDRRRALLDEGLLAFDPDGAERCFGLIDAVPWNTRQWALIFQQIGEAEHLLNRLEAQGRRLAAIEVERDHAALTRQAMRDAVFERRVASALAELKPYLEARTLAPYELRERLRRLAERSGGGVGV